MNDELTFIDSDELLKDPHWVRAITKREGMAREVAQVLVGARIEMGFTQARLAKKVGTTQSVIARTESGRSLPGLSFIEKVAKAYKTHARIVFESMPEVMPVAVRYAYLLAPRQDTSSRDAEESVFVDFRNPQARVFESVNTSTRAQ